MKFKIKLRYQTEALVEFRLERPSLQEVLIGICFIDLKLTTDDVRFILVLEVEKIDDRSETD